MSPSDENIAALARSIGVDAAQIIARHSLELTEADATLRMVASGYLLTLVAQVWPARNTRPRAMKPTPAQRALSRTVIAHSSWPRHGTGRSSRSIKQYGEQRIMKINMPVTNTEYVLRDTDSIVSKTDQKGIITYINEDFLRVSGFTDLGIASSRREILWQKRY